MEKSSWGRRTDDEDEAIAFAQGVVTFNWSRHLEFFEYTHVMKISRIGNDLKTLENRENMQLN